MVDSIALRGAVKSIPTTIILKICTPLPDIYNMKAFMGTDFAGAMATSQAFFCLRDSTSAGKGAALIADDDLLDFYKFSMCQSMRERYGLFRSNTHLERLCRLAGTSCEAGRIES